MKNFKFLFSFICVICLIINVCGCAQRAYEADEPKEQRVLGEQVVDGTIGAVTQTSEFARLITENTGSFTENLISGSSKAIKYVIVSLENLRKKSIETFGQKTVTEEAVGPALITCPYCNRTLQIKTLPEKNAQDRYQCPFCEKEFIVKWDSQ